MGRKSKTGVLKRLREVKKAEKAALKKAELEERREERRGSSTGEAQVATKDDLAGYGFPVDGDDDEESDAQA